MKKIHMKKKYLIALGIGLLITVITLLLRGIFSASTPKAVFRILADAFFSPGVLFLIAGADIWAMNQGAFDGLFYMAHTLFRARPQEEKDPLSEEEERKEESYADYVQRRHEEKQVSGYAYLFFFGAVFILLALLFVFFFNCVQ